MLAVMVASSLLLPSQSKAEGLWDWLFGDGDRNEHQDKKDHDKKDHDGDNQGGDNQGGDCSGGQHNSAPIDSGLSILLVAGLGLGAKMLYDNKKKGTETAAN